MWFWAAVRCGVRAAAPAPGPRPRPRLLPRPQAAPLPPGCLPSRAFSDGEWEAEAGEQELEEFIRAEKNKRKAIKYRQIQAENRGAPARTLTTEALEQIRFLKAKFPEEWSVSQLAKGFSVSEDVIRRVLRSKFIPSPERRMKQDAKVAAVTLTLSHRTKQPTVSLPSMSAPDRSRLGTDQAPLARLSQGPAILPVLPDSRGREKEVGRIKPVQQRSRTELTDQNVVKGNARRKEATSKERDECRETCDTSDVEQIPAGGMMDEELENLAVKRQESQMNVIQRGHEFYDQKDNFLYRITKHLNDPKQES